MFNIKIFFQSLGLRSLTKIERGAVRIQLNDRLCYTNTIDWSAIVGENDLPNIKIKVNEKFGKITLYL